MTTTPNLGRLSAVAPRKVWSHEAQDFTPWLLQNVDVLSDLLGMDLELEAAEHPVGGFSLDLLGRDLSDESVVIVENQLEQSDHTHLGQILTYAAGTNPKTIVWIATSFRPEHRAALAERTHRPRHEILRRRDTGRPDRRVHPGPELHARRAAERLGKAGEGCHGRGSDD